MSSVPTVGELKFLVEHVRTVQRRWASGACDPVEVTEATMAVFTAIDGLPENLIFATSNLLDQVVSRSLVEQALAEINELVVDDYNLGVGTRAVRAAHLLLTEALAP